MTYETFYSTGESVQEMADYVRSTLDGVPQERIVSVTHSMALNDPGTLRVMVYSALIVVRANDPAS
jgi:hypothetical protein